MGKKAILTAVGGAVAAVVAASALAFAVPAAANPVTGQAVAVGQAAATSTAATSTAAAGDKAADCDRLKKVQARRAALESRLQGDANSKGSIAWLTAKAAAATAAGDGNMAKLYTDKAALRSQLADPLKTVDADRAAIIQANCS